MSHASMGSYTNGHPVYLGIGQAIHVHKSFFTKSLL